MNGEGGHPGTDYGCFNGTPVLSASNGWVSYAGPATGFGDHAVSIYHPDDNVTTTYGHMMAHYYATGAYVAAGVPIGLSDNQGYSTGPHLHFEVRPGQAIFGGNPPNIDSDKWLHDHGAYGGNPFSPPGQLTAKDRQNIMNFQAAIGVRVDGGWGPQTDLAAQGLRFVCLNHNIKDARVARLQKLWSLVQDGMWGPKTDQVYLIWRFAYVNK
jgi:hypothetical protein